MGRRYRRIRPTLAAMACATALASYLVVPVFADEATELTESVGFSDTQVSAWVETAPEPIGEKLLSDEMLTYADQVDDLSEGFLDVAETVDSLPGPVDGLASESGEGLAEGSVDCEFDEIARDGLIEVDGAPSAEEEVVADGGDSVGTGAISEEDVPNCTEEDALGVEETEVTPGTDSVPNEGDMGEVLDSDVPASDVVDGTVPSNQPVDSSEPEAVEDVPSEAGLPVLSGEDLEASDKSLEMKTVAAATKEPDAKSEPHAPGWEHQDDVWRYYDKDGKLVTGEKCIDGAWYYFDSKNDGAMAKGLVELTGSYLANGPKTVYYGSDGKMVYGEKELNGSWSYLDPSNGALVRDSFAYLDGSYLIGGPKTCYYDADGKMVYGERAINDAWYYLDPLNGARAENEFVYLDGSYLAGGPKTCYYGSDGKMAYGEQQVAGDWYYLDPENGARVEDEFMRLDGSYLAGGPKTVYYDEQGKMAHGWGAAGGNVWWFNESSGNREYISNYFTEAWRQAQGFSSTTPYLVLTDFYDCKVTVYTGSKGSWKPLQCWTSSPGAYSTPTIMGTFKVGDRGYSFGSGYTCYYWTQFCGDYLFHSVLYDPGTFRIQDGRLGYNVSHGCVRLDINNARWIYDSIPRGTTVYSY